MRDFQHPQRLGATSTIAQSTLTRPSGSQGASKESLDWWSYSSTLRLQFSLADPGAASGDGVLTLWSSNPRTAALTHCALAFLTPKHIVYLFDRSFDVLLIGLVEPGTHQNHYPFTACIEIGVAKSIFWLPLLHILSVNSIATSQGDLVYIGLWHPVRLSMIENHFGVNETKTNLFVFPVDATYVSSPNGAPNGKVLRPMYNLQIS